MNSLGVVRKIRFFRKLKMAENFDLLVVLKGLIQQFQICYDNISVIISLCAKFHNFPMYSSMGCYRHERKKKNSNENNRCLHTFSAWPLIIRTLTITIGVFAPSMLDPDNNKKTDKYNRCQRTFGTWPLMSIFHK